MKNIYIAERNVCNIINKKLCWNRSKFSYFFQNNITTFFIYSSFWIHLNFSITFIQFKYLILSNFYLLQIIFFLPSILIQLIIFISSIVSLFTLSMDPPIFSKFTLFNLALVFSEDIGAEGKENYLKCLIEVAQKI